jgi:hypothetical protein
MQQSTVPRRAILSVGSTGVTSSEAARVIGIIFKPVKWALLALKVSGTRPPRHFGFVIRSQFHSITSSA